MTNEEKLVLLRDIMTDPDFCQYVLEVLGKTESPEFCPDSFCVECMDKGILWEEDRGSCPVAGFVTYSELFQFLEANYDKRS